MRSDGRRGMEVLDHHQRAFGVHAVCQALIARDDRVVEIHERRQRQHSSRWMNARPAGRAEGNAALGLLHVERDHLVADRPVTAVVRVVAGADDPVAQLLRADANRLEQVLQLVPLVPITSASAPTASPTRSRSRANWWTLERSAGVSSGTGADGPQGVATKAADLLEAALEHTLAPEEIEERDQPAVQGVGRRPVAGNPRQAPQLEGVLRNRVGRAGDPAHRPVDHRRECKRVDALEHRGPVAHPVQDRRHVLDVLRGQLDPGDVGLGHEAKQVVRRQQHAAHERVVVDHRGDGDGVGDGHVVAQHLVHAQRHVVGRHHEQAVRPDRLGVARRGNGQPRSRRTRPGEHGHTAGRLFHDDLRRPSPLGLVHVEELARRGVDDERLDARRDEAIDQAAEGGLVEVSGVRPERRQERDDDSLELGLHRVRTSRSGDLRGADWRAEL